MNPSFIPDDLMGHLWVVMIEMTLSAIFFIDTSLKDNKQAGAELCQAQLQLGSIKPGKDGKGRLQKQTKTRDPRNLN